MRPHTLIHTKLYVHESDDSLRKQETWSQCSLILAEFEEMDEEKVGVKGPCNLRRRKRSTRIVEKKTGDSHTQA